MEACPNQLLILKEILEIFASSTALKVNYNKSIMVPLNVTDERLDVLTSLFCCNKSSLHLSWLTTWNNKIKD